MRVGIDLGTTYCAVAYVNPKTGKAEVIPNIWGEPTTPSVLYFGKTEPFFTGRLQKLLWRKARKIRQIILNIIWETIPTASAKTEKNTRQRNFLQSF